jgi:hypothetical protein
MVKESREMDNVLRISDPVGTLVRFTACALLYIKMHFSFVEAVYVYMGYLIGLVSYTDCSRSITVHTKSPQEGSSPCIIASSTSINVWVLRISLWLDRARATIDNVITVQ